MQEKKTRPKPFQNSLSALARFAMRETGADGYALFRNNSDARTLVRHDAAGIGIGEDAVMNGLPGVVTYPAGTDGILAFAFRDETRLRDEKPRLDRIAGLIDTVWSAARSAGSYLELANEVAELEAGLMDSRIADRVRGLAGGPAEPSAVDVIVRHVEGVLRPATVHLLEQLSRSLGEEVEARRLANRAKAILQSVHG